MALSVFNYRKEFAGEGEDEKKGKVDRSRRRDRPTTRVYVPVSDPDDNEGWVEVSKEKQIQLFDPKQEVTHDTMISKIEEVMASRGRLGTNRKQHVRQLQELLRITEEVRFLFNFLLTRES